MADIVGQSFPSNLLLGSLWNFLQCYLILFLSYGTSAENGHANFSNIRFCSSVYIVNTFICFIYFKMVCVKVCLLHSLRLFLLYLNINFTNTLNRLEYATISIWVMAVGCLPLREFMCGPLNEVFFHRKNLFNYQQNVDSFFPLYFIPLQFFLVLLISGNLNIFVHFHIHDYSATIVFFVVVAVIGTVRCHSLYCLPVSSYQLLPLTVCYLEKTLNSWGFS